MFRYNEWPALFSVGMIDQDEQNNGNNDINEQLLRDFKVVPLYSANIDLRKIDSSILSNEGSGSAGSNQTQICVLNPGSYKQPSEMSEESDSGNT